MGDFIIPHRIAIEEARALASKPGFEPLFAAELRTLERIMSTLVPISSTG